MEHHGRVSFNAPFHGGICPCFESNNVRIPDSQRQPAMTGIQTQIFTVANPAPFQRAISGAWQEK